MTPPQGIRLGFCIVLLLAAGCLGKKADFVRGDKLRVSPAGPLQADGELVQIELIGADGSLVELNEKIAALFKIEPHGILEPAGGLGQYRAVGVGNVQVEFRPGTFSLVTNLQVTCPTAPQGLDTHTDHIITESTRWLGQHLVEGILQINSGTLEIGACAEITMGADAEVVVGGAGLEASLVIRGTPGSPLRMASATAGVAWNGIRVNAVDAPNTVFSGVELTGARGIPTADGARAVIDIRGDMQPRDHSSITLTSVRIDGTDGCDERGLQIRELPVTANLKWSDIEISDCGTFPVSVDASSMGAAPIIEGNNGDNRVHVLGGSTGPNYQVWRDVGIPYFVESDISFAPVEGLVSVPQDRGAGGIYIVVMAGATFQFAPNTGLYIGRPISSSTDNEVRFIAQGVSSRPVVFTSAAASPGPGDWVGVVLMPGMRTALIRDKSSFGLQQMSRFHNTIVEYAGATPDAAIAGPVPATGGFVVLVDIAERDPRPFYVLDGTTMRNNLGFGLVSTITEEVDALSLQDSVRFFGLPLCFCGNTTSSVWTPAGEGSAGTDPMECMGVEPPSACRGQSVAW